MEHTDSERWQWLLRNPDSARALFALLEKGNKGNASDLTKMVDRVLTAEKRKGLRYDWGRRVPCETAPAAT